MLDFSGRAGSGRRSNLSRKSALSLLCRSQDFLISYLNTYLLSLSNNCSLESLRESRRRRAKGTRLLRQIAAGGGKTQEMQIIRPKAPRFWCN